MRFGMAIAAMIRMIATTISNSIREKPFGFRISFFLSLLPPSERDFDHTDGATESPDTASPTAVPALCGGPSVSMFSDE
jgi:hypothetical protein